jgi:tRNA A-37 threonylcarbamoyl transferase component Bud32
MTYDEAFPLRTVIIPPMGTNLPRKPVAPLADHRRMDDAAGQELTEDLGSADPASIDLVPGAENTDSRLLSASGDSLSRPNPGFESRILGGRYVLERQIGAGATSVVYRARDIRCELGGEAAEYVALKVLKGELREQSQGLLRLKREFHHAQELSHPNIIRVFDLDCDEGAWFITMELLQGQTLATALQQDARGNRPPIDSQRILEGCARALDYAHSKGVVHCDFKPANIFITRENDIRVLDFGSACAYRQRLEADRLRSTTLIYASPQVLSGEASEPSDDIFSFACVAYEALTGHHPFGGESALEARETELPLLRRVGLSNQQWRALTAGLSWERELRPASATEFYRALLPIAAHGAPQDLAAQVGRSLEGHWSGAGIVPIAMIAALVAWVSSGLLGDGPPRQSAAQDKGAAAAAAAVLSGSNFSMWTQKSPVAPLLVDRSVIAAGHESQGLPSVPVPRPLLASLSRPDAASANTYLSLTGTAATPTAAPRQQVGFAEPSLAVSQHAHAAVLTLARQNGSSGRVRVFWKTIDGSARAGLDYVGVSAGTAEFAEHESRRALYIGLKPNDRTGNRSFMVELSGISGNAKINGVTRVPVTLIDY